MNRPEPPPATERVAEPARRRGRRRRRALWALAASTLVGLLLWFVVIPYPWTLRTTNPAPTALMQQRLDEARAAGSSLEIRQEWVALEDVSPRLVRAVLVAEDYRFREHAGVDWVSLAEEVRWSGDDDFSWTSAADLAALREALAFVWANRSELRGRSTITQQLAKNLYFGTDRSLLRKAMEFVVARRLERRLGKDRILELYLNVAEWGPGLFGVEAAARTYFGTSAGSVTLDQAAALAGTLPHPLTSNPSHRPGRMAWRRDLILARLDPASGIPPAPLPLTPPAIDPVTGIGLSLDTLVVDTLLADTITLDTSSLGTPSVDSLGLDTLRLDSLGLDTLRVDTLSAVPARR